MIPRNNTVVTVFPELAKAATEAAIRGDSPGTRNADIKLIQAHIDKGMSKEDKSRAELTIAAIQSGGRRYNFEIKPLCEMR